MYGTHVYLLLITILILSQENDAGPDKIMNKFIGDFFMDKSIMVTAHFCWNYDKIHDFLKYMSHIPKLKQIAVYNNSIDYFNFFYHKSSDNYFLIDMNSCNASWNLLLEVNSTELFRFPLKYLLLISEDDFEDKLPEALSNYTIFPTTDIIVAKRVDRDYQLYQPYRVDRVQDIIWEKYGEWSEEQGVVLYSSRPLSRRRRDLRQTKLWVGFHMDTEDTWNHLEDMKEPRVDTFSKQNFPTVKALIELTNFNAQVVRTTDYGYYNEETRLFGGLVRMVELKQIDLSGSSPFFTDKRFEVVDFIKMLNKMQMQFLLKKPPLSFMHNIFVLPFSRRVWIAMAAICVLFFMAMFIIMNFESRQLTEANEREKYTISDIVLLVFEGVCQQGTVMESKLIPGRILQFIMFLSFMFLFTSFSAYIIVLLQSTIAITSWKQLLESRIAVGVHNTSYMHVYITGSKNPIHQAIYNKKIGPKGYFNIDVGMAKVQQGFYALHAEVAGAFDYIAEHFTDFEICQVQILEGFVEHYKGHTCLPKNSPYKEIFKVGLMRIDEYGIQRRNFNRLLKPPKCYSPGGNFVSVGIIEMGQALYIFGYGLALSVALLFLEIFVKWKLNRRNRFKHETVMTKNKFKVSYKN